LPFEQRPGYLRNVAQAAEYILVGTIADTSYYNATPERQRPEIMTVYTVTVREIVRGPATSAATIRFQQPGGCTGHYTRIVPPQRTYELGASYLLFLARCGTDSILASIDAGEADALVVNDSAKFRGAQDSASLSTTRDSLRAYMAELTPESQRRHSDIVAIVMTDTMMDDSTEHWDAYKNGIWSCRVKKVLHQLKGPALTPNAAIRFRVARVDRPTSLTLGATPRLSGNRECVVFLSFADPEWILAASAYAVWERVGNTGRVLVDLPQCNGVVSLAVCDWDALLDSLDTN
jgi:hypothetical protein